MHELAVTKGVLKVVLNHAENNNITKVVSVSLRIGALRDIVDEWMQRYFDYVSRNTIAEGAKIKINRIPIVVKCEDCNELYPIKIREIEFSHCPNCGKKEFHIVTGREFLIEEIEVI